MLSMNFFLSIWKAFSKEEILFRCLRDYLEGHTISLECITAVATDAAPSTMVDKGFATLLKQNLLNILVIHFVLHRSHLVVKKA